MIAGGLHVGQPYPDFISVDVFAGPIFNGRLVTEG